MFKYADENDLTKVNYFLSLFNQPELSFIDNNSAFKYLFYIEDNKYIGFLSYSVLYDFVEIDYIYVDEAYHHLGIGSKLINYLLEELNINLKGKIKFISLEVRESNVNAIKFYEKFNFKKTSVRKKYYRNEDAIIMTREVI